jgi:hypothetical protein
MNALARYIQHFDTDEVAPPADLMIAPRVEVIPELPVDKVADAQAEGRRIGRDEAERAFEARLAVERESFAQLLVDERARWSAEESERLAQAFTAAAETLVATVSEASSRALVPFVTGRAREIAIADLVATLRALLTNGKHPVVTVSGARDLMAEIANRLGSRADGLTFEATDGLDVRVTADSTIIETQLAAWLDRLAGSQE